MIDATGAPQTILVLGGTSDLALASVEAFAASGRVRAVALAARPSARLDAAVQQVRAAGVDRVTPIALDATDLDAHGPALAEAHEALGDIDVTILAVGVLGDQATYDADPAAAAAAAMTNFGGPMSLCLHLAPRLRAQGHGALVVLSSVAAMAPRASAAVYAATKAGLDAFALALGDALDGSGVTVTVVRPGFVRTRMTAGLSEAPLATDAGVVAAAVVGAVRDRRTLVHVPPLIRPVMLGLRALPRAVFRRLPL